MPSITEILINKLPESVRQREVDIPLKIAEGEDPILINLGVLLSCPTHIKGEVLALFDVSSMASRKNKIKVLFKQNGHGPEISDIKGNFHSIGVDMLDPNTGKTKYAIHSSHHLSQPIILADTSRIICCGFGAADLVISTNPDDPTLISVSSPKK